MQIRLFVSLFLKYTILYLYLLLRILSFMNFVEKFENTQQLLQFYTDFLNVLIFLKYRLKISEVFYRVSMIGLDGGHSEITRPFLLISVSAPNASHPSPSLQNVQVYIRRLVIFLLGFIINTFYFEEHDIFNKYPWVPHDRLGIYEIIHLILNKEAHFGEQMYKKAMEI